jgi:hypothetical protein
MQVLPRSQDEEIELLQTRIGLRHWNSTSIRTGTNTGASASASTSTSIVFAQEDEQLCL